MICDVEVGIVEIGGVVSAVMHRVVVASVGALRFRALCPFRQYRCRVLRRSLRRGRHLQPCGVFSTAMCTKLWRHVLLGVVVCDALLVDDLDELK